MKNRKLKCRTGKNILLSESEAETRLLFMMWLRSDGEKKEIRYYKCEACGYYHLTSKQKWEEA